MYDTIEKLQHSTIQHGKYNDRIYLMKLDPQDFFTLPGELEKLAEQEEYSKIFTKIPVNACMNFQHYQFTKEAYIPKFFNGRTPAYFMSKFVDRKRAHLSIENRQIISDIIKLAKSKAKQKDAPLAEGLEIRHLTEKDIPQLTSLYKQVFKTYPFPIFEDDYIAETMKDHILYFGLFDKDTLLAASSCEMDKENLNVEMTDFATNPDHLGNGYAYQLLRAMDKEMRAQEFVTAFTIARAVSHGMNITFSKRGYNFSGTLINNTNINGEIECMNVWYKTLLK